MGSIVRERHLEASSPMAGERCRRCRHNPASPRIFGYCSWDCHDSDGDDEEEGQEAA
jgi:hypothetical protein